MNPLLGFLIGGALGLGILLTFLGFQPAPERRKVRPTKANASSRPAWLKLTPREKKLAAAGLLVGVLLWILQGWITAALLGPVIAVGLPRLLHVPGQDKPEELEALEEWVRSLRAVLRANLPLGTAITQTLNSCPERVRPQVERLVERIHARQNLTTALYQFGDDLDSQTGDFVATALVEASRIGSGGLGEALGGIAAEVADEVRMRRDIGVVYAKAISQARLVTIFFTVMMIGVVAFSPLGQTYRTGIGQIILLGIAVFFTLCLIWIRRRVTPTAPARFLVRPQEQA